MTKSHLSPHDRYIRSVLSNLTVAREFFAKNLPLEVVEAIDFSTINPQKDSFVNDKLRLKVADLLFSVNFNEDPGYLYLLMEHASIPDQFLPYRMLQYVMNILEHHRKKYPKEKKLPLVVPLILYTGNKPYTHSTDMFDLFGAEKELAKSVFLSPYRLVELNNISDETLRETYYWFSTAALIAKHIRNKDLVSLFGDMIDLLKRLKNNGHDDYVYLTISYGFEAGEVKDKEAFRAMIRSGFSSEDEEKIMTLAEHYRQLGRQEAMAEKTTLAEQYHQQGKLEGKLEGKIEALHETALNFLKLGISVEQVAQATTLSLQEVQDLWKKNATKH